MQRAICDTLGVWNRLTSQLRIFSAERLLLGSRRLHDALRRPATLLVSEDHWTSHLFAGDLRTIDDYGRFSARLRAAMGPHIVAILQRGVSIVLDFPANTVGNRNWVRSLITQANVAHELHLLDVPDAIGKQRLRERNEGGEHPFQVSEAEYDLFTSYFVPPGPSEGFNIVVHSP